jgi:hypothetical protein
MPENVSLMEHAIDAILTLRVDPFLDTDGEQLTPTSEQPGYGFTCFVLCCSIMMEYLREC